MAILNRFSAILLYCDSTHFFASRCGIFWRFQACDSGNRAIRDSRFCAAKLGSEKNTYHRVLQGAPPRGRQLYFTCPGAPDPLFKASRAPFLTLKAATPSGAPRQALLEDKDKNTQTNFSRDCPGILGGFCLCVFSSPIRNDPQKKQT